MVCVRVPCVERYAGLKILMFIYSIYNHNWRNISTIYIYIYIYIYNKTSIKRNILTIKKNTSGNRSGQGLISTPVIADDLLAMVVNNFGPDVTVDFVWWSRTSVFQYCEFVIEFP